jgi:predicted PurR-regulated permease PerM
MAKKAARKKSAKTPAPVALVDDAVISAARLHLWQIQAVRDVLVAAAVVGLIWIGYALRAVTVPLLVALLLAYLFEPVIEWLCRHPRWKLTRFRAVTLLLVALGGAVLVALAATMPLVVGQTIHLKDYVGRGELREDVAKITSSMPDAIRADYEGFLRLLPGAAPEAQPHAAPVPADAAPAGLTEEAVRAIVAGEVQRRQQAADETGPDWMVVAREGANTLLNVLGGILQIGLVTFLVPFYFFFFSLWYPSVVRFGRGLVPRRNKQRILELIRKMDVVVSGFVRGRITISFIMGVLLAFGWLLCGVPHAIPLGLLVGIFCAVPYLGVVGIPLAVGFDVFQEFGEREAWGMWLLWTILWPTVVFSIVQVIEGYVLTPMIAGKVTNLDPVTIIVAVLAGGSVLGVYGMLLAIPAAACGKILFMEVLLPRIQAWTRGEVADPLPIKRG